MAQAATPRDDFEAIRQAVATLEVQSRAWVREPGTPQLVTDALIKLLWHAGRAEVNFIRLAKAGVQNEVIDLAWAVLGKVRPGGPATPKEDR